VTGLIKIIKISRVSSVDVQVLPVLCKLSSLLIDTAKAVYWSECVYFVLIAVIKSQVWLLLLRIRYFMDEWVM